MPTYQRQPILPVAGYSIDDRPRRVNPSPLPSAPKSKPGKEAAKLWAHALALTERLRESQTEAVAAGERLEAAQAALASEVTRGAVTGDRDAARESELIAGVRQAEVDADAGILQHRYRALLAAQLEAVTKAQQFIRINLAELIEAEYRPLAEEVWSQLETAEAGDSRSALEAAREAYEDARSKVASLAPWAFDKAAFVVPAEGLPLPPPESYTRPESAPLPPFQLA